MKKGNKKMSEDCKEKTKEFLESCNRILDFFDRLLPESEYGERDHDRTLTDFLFGKELGEIDSHQMIWDISGRSFALGYLIGSRFEITYPEAQKDIGVIQKVIREKQLLPYLPREKRAT